MLITTKSLMAVINNHSYLRFFQSVAFMVKYSFQLMKMGVRITKSFCHLCNDYKFIKVVFKDSLLQSQMATSLH